MKIEGIINMEYFSKGKRGVIHTGDYGGKKVVVKVKNPYSKAVGRIANEINFLKLLNKEGIGPKMLGFGEDHFFYEFIEGEFIEDFLRKSSKAEILEVIKIIFDQMFKLDKMGINKEEMHHPYKHIIVTANGNPVLIDFERCRRTISPKNVVQFCNYATGARLERIFYEKGVEIDKNKIIELEKIYKRQRTKGNLIKILREIR